MLLFFHIRLGIFIVLKKCHTNDKNGNQLATVNRYEIPSDKKDSTYVDIDVTLGDNRLNENVVNHYNALNQLTQTLTKNYKVSFTYDTEGLRTSKTVNGEKTVFVWDGDQLVLELSEGGKVQKRYIRGNDLVYADKGMGIEKQFYVTDPHGNVVQLTDEKGKVTKTYEYDSFGNEVNPDSKDDNPFRYCGEYYDKETGEVYLRARYYQSSVGRFLTRDTYTGESDDLMSLHLYAYCGNDGVNAWDSSGHFISKNYVGAKIGTLYGGLGIRFKEYFENISKGSKNFYIVSACVTSSNTKALNTKTIEISARIMNANYIESYMLEKGWARESISAIIGNFYQECRMNPGNWEDWQNTSKGYGLAQWTEATKFLNYAGLNEKTADEWAKRKPKELMDKQLEYFLDSFEKDWFANPNLLYGYKKMSKEEFKKNKKKASIKELVYTFNSHYEKSGDDKKFIRIKRVKPAIDYYKSKTFKGEYNQ